MTLVEDLVPSTRPNSHWFGIIFINHSWKYPFSHVRFCSGKHVLSAEKPYNSTQQHQATRTWEEKCITSSNKCTRCISEYNHYQKHYVMGRPKLKHETICKSRGDGETMHNIFTWKEKWPTSHKTTTTSYQQQ